MRSHDAIPRGNPRIEFARCNPYNSIPQCSLHDAICAMQSQSARMQFHDAVWIMQQSSHNSSHTTIILIDTILHSSKPPCNWKDTIFTIKWRPASPDGQRNNFVSNKAMSQRSKPKKKKQMIKRCRWEAYEALCNVDIPNSIFKGRGGADKKRGAESLYIWLRRRRDRPATDNNHPSLFRNILAKGGG